MKHFTNSSNLIARPEANPPLDWHRPLFQPLVWCGKIRSLLLGALLWCVLTLLAALAPRAVGEGFKSYTLTKINQTPMLTNHEGHPTRIATGLTKILNFQADSKGGSFEAEDSYPEWPDKPVRHYTIAWAFDRDLRVIAAGQTIAVEFTITGVDYKDNYSPGIRLAPTGYATNGELVAVPGTANSYILYYNSNNYGPTPPQFLKSNGLARVQKTTFKYTNGPKIEDAGGFDLIIDPDGYGVMLAVSYHYNGQYAPATPEPPATNPTTTSAPQHPQPPSGGSSSMSPPASAPSGIDLSGNWLHVGIPNAPDAPVRIVQNSGQVTIINELNNSFPATWENANTIVIPDEPGMPGGLRGTVSSGGNQIQWSNNTTWQRATAGGLPVVSKMTLRAETKQVKPGDTVLIPIWLQKGEGVINLGFNVAYDPSVVQAQSPVTKGNLLDGASFEANPGNAGTVELGVVVPRTGGITASEGTVAVIAFKAVGRAGTRTPLTIVRRKSSITGGSDADFDTIYGEIIITDTPGRGPWTAADALDALKMAVHLIPVNMDYDVNHDGKVETDDARIIAEMASGKKF